MTVKALKKQLMAAIAMVVVSAIALSSSTYAWFAQNNIVSATNMMITATTSQSLVISRDSLPTEQTGTITVAASDTSATALIPATHDSTWATYTTGLKYNTNPGNVSASTGLVESGKSALTFAVATNTESNLYYKDYVVFIAANGGALSGQDIAITLQNDTVTTLPGATSIDFYYQAVTEAVTTVTPSTATFAGTLNLAKLDPVANDASTAKTTVTISNINIPEASASSPNAIAVLMRAYVDGALLDAAAGENPVTPATTFVKNIDKAEVAGQTLAVDFTASEHVDLEP